MTIICSDFKKNAKSFFVGILVIVMVILTPESAKLYADIYIGLKDWEANWQIGVADTLNKKTGETKFVQELLASSGNKIAIQTIRIPAARMRLIGGTLSYIEKNWSLNYASTFGSSRLKGNSNIFTYTYDPGISEAYYLEPRPLDINVRRSDHDFTLSRLLGESGFYIFLGFKSMRYDYDNPANFIPAPWYYESGSSTQFGLSFVSSAIKIIYDSTGPSAGLGFSLALSRNQSLGISLGWTGLSGTIEYETDSTYYESSRAFGIVRLRQKEDMFATGYTADLTYNYFFAKVHLFRVSLRRQETTYQTSNPSGYYFNLSSSNDITVIPVLDIPFFNLSFNGSQDIFTGFSFAFLIKI